MQQEIEIQMEEAVLKGSLHIPPHATAIVVFCHGSGSSRFSPRNRYVADVLQHAGLATLLFDLLTKEEEALDAQTREFRFNVRLLADRMKQVTSWLKNHTTTKKLHIMFFGASTGAAGALIAAAELEERIYAIVSRGGRPDLAEDSFPLLRTPTLLLVGECDPVVVDLNLKALDMLPCEKRLEVIPGATHLFEEPGTLEQVARIACEWFVRHR